MVIPDVRGWKRGLRSGLFHATARFSLGTGTVFKRAIECIVRRTLPHRIGTSQRSKKKINRNAVYQDQDRKAFATANVLHNKGNCPLLSGKAPRRARAPVDKRNRLFFLFSFLSFFPFFLLDFFLSFSFAFLFFTQTERGRHRRPMRLTDLEHFRTLLEEARVVRHQGVACLALKAWRHPRRLEGLVIVLLVRPIEVVRRVGPQGRPLPRIRRHLFHSMTTTNEEKEYLSSRDSSTRPFYLRLTHTPEGRRLTPWGKYDGSEKKRKRKKEKTLHKVRARK